MFLDEKTDYSVTYYYKVSALNKSGLPGAFSNEAFVHNKDNYPQPAI
jgi:hypothetical protein